MSECHKPYTNETIYLDKLDLQTANTLYRSGQGTTVSIPLSSIDLKGARDRC